MSSDREIAISVRNVSKCYEIYEKPAHRLYQMLWRGHRKFYKEFWALRDITFDVRRGECVGIIGRNGAGKSTLLQIITGTLRATSGAVDTRGKIGALLELGSGFNPEFTGKENVFLNATLLGLTRRQTMEKYQEIVDFADIGEFIDRPVKTYSSGMRVRLAFAVQIVVEPEILIVDEALSVGDATFQQKCMRRMRKYMEDHTVLFVSHSMGAIKNLCSRAIYLKDGRISMTGAPKDVTNLYLKDTYAAVQRVDNAAAAALPVPAPEEEPEWRDMRLDVINHSNLRNDLEAFDFNPDAPSFGEGGVRITQVCLTDLLDRPLKWIVGGEMVKLRIRCFARKEMLSPIIGFYVKDRLGQKLFGDNTYLTYEDDPLFVPAGKSFVGEFTFAMPILPRGQYSIMAAIAEGTQTEHVQHHWIHEAMFFESHTNSIAVGLAGLPMKKIELRCIDGK